METRICAGCGVGIEGRPVTFRGRDFCGDQCCEEFEVTFALKGGPEEDELDEDLDDFDEDDFDDEDLDLDDDEDEDEDAFDLDLDDDD
ncbi:MAG: hypothetical protein IH621_13185 [Krumholzibacteria bacterium]|nr:hypothetical protein [Candidatus Krumholzibacteria bacterium]